MLTRTGAGILAVPAQVVRPGHVMVVSATHARAFSDLQSAEADAFMALVGAVARAAEQASGAERYYVVRIGDQSPHLHFHLVPRVQGDAPLAPFVFGDHGWSAGIRSDALPPAALFEAALTQGLRIDHLANRATQDAGRLPASLVRLAISIAVLSAVLLAGWPTLGPAWAGPLAFAAGIAAGQAAEDRMKGQAVRWLKAVARGGVAALVYVLITRWLAR